MWSRWRFLIEKYPPLAQRRCGFTSTEKTISIINMKWWARASAASSPSPWHIFTLSVTPEFGSCHQETGTAASQLFCLAPGERVSKAYSDEDPWARPGRGPIHTKAPGYPSSFSLYPPFHPTASHHIHLSVYLSCAGSESSWCCHVLCQSSSPPPLPTHTHLWNSDAELGTIAAACKHDPLLPHCTFTDSSFNRTGFTLSC